MNATVPTSPTSVGILPTTESFDTGISMDPGGIMSDPSWGFLPSDPTSPSVGADGSIIPAPVNPTGAGDNQWQTFAQSLLTDAAAAYIAQAKGSPTPVVPRQAAPQPPPLINTSASGSQVVIMLLVVVVLGGAVFVAARE